jgi:hypothetical protein
MGNGNGNICFNSKKGAMKKIAVLGLGESICEFEKKSIMFALSIGVNDIWRKIETDYVVCIDRPDRFTDDRLKVINESKPQRFYSQLNEWSGRPDFYRIELQPNYPNYMIQLNIPAIPKSFCSPFVAAAIAFKLHKADEIHLFGVDLLNHPNLNGRTVEKIRDHFILMRDELNKQNVSLIVHGNGALKSVTN